MRLAQASGRMLRRITNMLGLLPLLVVAALVLWLSLTDGRGTQAMATPADGISYTTADSEGRPAAFTLSHTPARVLISYPGATELLIDLGLSDRIIGTIAPYGAEPPAYADTYASLPILAAPYVQAARRSSRSVPISSSAGRTTSRPRLSAMCIRTLIAASAHTLYLPPYAEERRRSKRQSTRLSATWGISSAQRNVLRTISMR